MIPKVNLGVGEMGFMFCDLSFSKITFLRVATVREKVLENEKFSRSGKSQGITFSVREIEKK